MELASWFISGLREYDDSLTAIYDDHQDEIHLYYTKSGNKSLAYSVSRESGELYPELQRRILKELPMKDVWKRFGSGEEYDEYLDRVAREAMESNQKKIDSDRFARMKEDRRMISHARENARSGRFSIDEAISYEIPTVSVLKDIPKEGESETL